MLRTNIIPALILLIVFGGIAFSQKTFVNSQINGTWKYQSDIFKIQVFGKNKLKIEYQGLWEYKYEGELIANVGVAKGFAILQNNKAIFKFKEKPECRMVLNFALNRLNVEDNGKCEFGRHVNPGGNYRRVNHKKPKFKW